jgi:DNA topoisomerase-2
LKNKLKNLTNELITFIPYYEGFKGQIQKISETKFLFKGIYEILGPDKIRVTELPVGHWTQDFKEHLENLQESSDKEGKKITPIVKDYDDMSKDTNVDFTIIFQKGKLDELLNSKGDYECNGVEKVLKLYSTNSLTNMNLFNAEDKLKKYNNVCEVIDDYFNVRLEYYKIRKDYIVNALEKELQILENKSRYIEEVLEGTIDLRKKAKPVIISILKEKNYTVIENDEDYKYLLKMAMDSVSEENVNRLQKEHKEKVLELDEIKNTKIGDIWLKELNELDKVYLEYMEERQLLLKDEKPTKKHVVKIVKKK